MISSKRHTNAKMISHRSKAGADLCGHVKKAAACLGILSGVVRNRYLVEQRELLMSIATTTATTITSNAPLCPEMEFIQPPHSTACPTI